MEEIPQHLLVEAKNMLTKQLVNTLAPHIFEGFNSLYQEAVEFKEGNRNPDFREYTELQIFQDYLRKIPKWNQDLIDKETDRIVTKSRMKESVLEQIIQGVFSCHAQILSVIRLRNKSQGLKKLKVPTVRVFIHKCYMECSREIYKNVYLFDEEEVTTIEKQKNNRDVINIIKEGIIESVEKLLPYEDIMKTYLGNPENTENTDTASIASGLEEKMFHDFAKNKLKKSVEQILSDHEESSSKHSHRESSSSSASEESSQHDEHQEEVVEEHQFIPENISPVISQNVEEMVKIQDEPHVEVFQPPPVYEPPTQEEQIVKTILNKAELVNTKEKTDESFTKENEKRIINEEEEKRRKEREQRHREREERHRLREERHRIRDEKKQRKIIRNKDKIAMERQEQTAESTNQTYTQTQTQSVAGGYSSDEGYSFGGPKYVEQVEE